MRWPWNKVDSPTMTIDEIVNRLEPPLMPKLMAAATAIDAQHLTVESFSHRHAHCFHAFGVKCFPAGSTGYDSETFAIVLKIVTINEPWVRAEVWRADQELKSRPECESVTFERLNERKMILIERAALSLMPTLAKSLRRDPARRARAISTDTPASTTP